MVKTFVIKLDWHFEISYAFLIFLLQITTHLLFRKQTTGWNGQLQICKTWTVCSVCGAGWGCWHWKVNHCWKADRGFGSQLCRQHECDQLFPVLCHTGWPPDCVLHTWFQRREGQAAAQCLDCQCLELHGCFQVTRAQFIVHALLCFFSILLVLFITLTLGTNNNIN